MPWWTSIGHLQISLTVTMYKYYYKSQKELWAYKKQLGWLNCWNVTAAIFSCTYSWFRFKCPHLAQPHLWSIASVAVQTVERLLSLLGHDGSSTNDPLSPTVVIDRPPRRTNYWCPTLGCYHAPRPGWLELLAAHPRLCSGINPEPIIWRFNAPEP